MGKQRHDLDDARNWKAADLMAAALELFRGDLAYAEALGATNRGADYLSGVESALNAASINHDL
ncbi:hypothetical protein [Arthrobacter sp.]|uniref:hypothetical protein n=1 Tax=Arthrobacter sp. TaxID=1667 RepID=UPI003A91D2B6